MRGKVETEASAAEFPASVTRLVAILWGVLHLLRIKMPKMITAAAIQGRRRAKTINAMEPPTNQDRNAASTPWADRRSTKITEAPEWRSFAARPQSGSWC